MDTWQLSERVKRISLPIYEYGEQDLEHLQIIIAETGEGTMAGIATIEAADVSDGSRGHKAALLHGIYVDPHHHRSGIGTCLLKQIQTIAASRGFDGLLVKASHEATSFFAAQGFTSLPIEDPARDYPYRYWKLL